MLTRSDFRTLGTVSLLAGGILILLGSLIFNMWGWSGPMGNMMANYGSGWQTQMWWGTVASIVTGGLVLLAAFELTRGADGKLWGAVAIVAGTLSLAGMGGFMLGTFFAVAGGALAIFSETLGQPTA